MVHSGATVLRGDSANMVIHNEMSWLDLKGKQPGFVQMDF